MAPSSIDPLYERAASFGRDVFHYIVTGTLFAVVSSVPWWSKLSEWQADDIAPIFGDAPIQIALASIALIVLFGVGHVLLALGFWMRKGWMCVFRSCSHVKNHKKVLGSAQK